MHALFDLLVAFDGFMMRGPGWFAALACIFAMAIPAAGRAEFDAARATARDVLLIALAPRDARCPLVTAAGA